MRRSPALLGLPLLAAAVLASGSPAHAVSVAPPRVPPGTTAGYVVFDRQSGKIVAHRNARRQFRSASVIKILLAVDFLERTKKVSAGDLELLKVMLRSSDDDAASAFWNRGGKGQIVVRMARKLGLTETTPPPAAKPGFWGYVSFSARDVVTTYRYLLDTARPDIRQLVLGHLRAATPCGTDGFDQTFGIPSAVPRPWAVKQGWSGFGTVPPVKCKATRSTTHSLTPATQRTTPQPPSTKTQRTSPQPQPATGQPATTQSQPLPAAQPVAPAVAAAHIVAPRKGGAGQLTQWTASVGELTGRTASGGELAGRTASGGELAGRTASVPDLGRPVLHTTGLVGPGERYILVLLTAHPAGGTWTDSVKRINRLTAALYRSLL
ncbi:hypothetical protein [Nonomuraea sp. NPDC050310]|uniref:hypothetical protein n=1 Tax=Nonomuraea sp. NPDC050310 TaxID=3154935 RepID=UPI0033D93AA3